MQWQARVGSDGITGSNPVFLTIPVQFRDIAWANQDCWEEWLTNQGCDTALQTHEVPIMTEKEFWVCGILPALPYTQKK